ncbi:MICAL-like protein 1 [Lineus longissimus]|uniref:MICAL-like protein 1 n=1 Tax=Lineus longissimus TaxID=88925 RepID=UPI002B4F7337
MASGALKMKGLLQWCKKHTEGYPGVEVTNFTSAWKDGLAFCAIIHKFRPDLIDFNSLSKENVLENNALAFRLAEQELGIPALLDAEDMVAMRVPDKLCIVTYVSQYYNHLRDKNPEGGPGVQKAVKRPGATSPTSAPESKRISKAPQTQTPEKSNGLPSTSKRGTLGDTCTECKKKVYLLERHILEGKLYHRQCYRQSEKGRENFTSRPLSPTSPTKSFGPGLSPQNTNQSSPFRQRQNVPDEKLDSPQRVASRPKIPDSLQDKSGETKSKGTNNNRPVSKQQQGARTESPMDTNENDSSEPAWMRWVDKSAVPEKKSPEKRETKSTGKTGAISNGAMKDNSPDSSGKAESEFNVQFGKKQSPSSTPRTDKQWGKKTDNTGDSGATSKPAWAQSDPKAGLRSVADSTRSSSPKTRPKTDVKDNILDVRKDTPGTTLASSTSSTNIQLGNTNQEKEAAKAGLLKSLAGIRGLGEGASTTPAADKNTPGKFTIRTNDTATPSTLNMRGKSPARQDRSPGSSTGNVNKLTTPLGETKPNDKQESPVLSKPKRDVSPGISKLKSPDQTKRDPSPGTSKFKSPENTANALPTGSPSKMAPSKDKVPTASITKPVGDSVLTTSITKPHGDKVSITGIVKKDSPDKKSSPKTRRPRSPQKTERGAKSAVSLKDVTESDTVKTSISISVDLKPAATGQASKKFETVTVDVKIPADSSPSRPLSVIPGGDPPPKPPRTLLRDAKLDNRPEWQIEAEKRTNARKGGYKDPEKPWLYKDTDSPPKMTTDAKRTSDYPDDKNPFGADDVDQSPVKEKKYRSNNPFGSTDTLDQSPLEERQKYKPANPFAGSSDSEEDIENPFEGDDLPIKTSTLRPDETKKSGIAGAPEPTQKHAWLEDKKPEEVRKRAAPRLPGPAVTNQSPSKQNTKQNNLTPNLTPPVRPARPMSEGNTARTASPSRLKGKAPRPPGPLGTPGSTPQGSPVKTNIHLSPARHVPKVEPPKPEWVGSPMKNLRKITPDKIEFNRMSSTEIESDSSGLPDSPEIEHRRAMKSPSVRRSVKSMPAPPHPVPASRRKIITEERISPDQIIRELDDLDQKQTEIEKKARILEETIRDAEINESPNEDELLQQWFELVNDKNQLVRREADLVYIDRQQELEEMHAEIEHELRHLMSKQEQLKTSSDRAREEELLQELLEVVNKRNYIVENMDEDRLRYEEEDRVIEEMMASKFDGKANSSDEKIKQKKKKDKKKKKHKGSEFSCVAARD